MVDVVINTPRVEPVNNVGESMIDNDVNLERPGDSSSPENAARHTPPSGETDEFVPERDPDTGQVKPVPYDRFHQVNERYRSTRTDLEQAQHKLQ